MTTSASLFKREISVSRPEDKETGREVSQLASATWQSIEAHDEPRQLELSIPLEGTSKVIVSVDEGDNTPLPILSATLLIDSTRLRFFHPAGDSLRLLYGNPKLNPPRYDLALIAPSLLSDPARELALEPEGMAGTAPPEGKKTFFWIALIAVVVILVGLLVQLLRKQDEPAEASGE